MRSLRSDARPLYLRAVDALYELIESGVYAAGESLPSEAELALRLGVSRSTIREALSYLEKDDLILRKQGVGTFVAPRPEHISGGLERLAPFRSVAEQAGARVEVIERTVCLAPADAATAAVLEAPLDCELVLVQVVEAVDGRPLAYLEGWISPAVVDYGRLAADEGSLLEHLAGRADLAISYSRSAVYAIEAGQDLAGRLDVPEGKAILYLAETVYTDVDVPIALFRNYFITDWYNLKIVRRIVRTAGQGGRIAHEGT